MPAHHRKWPPCTRRTLVQDQALVAQGGRVRDALVHHRDLVAPGRRDARLHQVPQRRRAAPPTRARAPAAPAAARQRAGASAQRLPC